MADGVPITPGEGATVATDDAGEAGQVQIVKLSISADGSATVIPADATNGLDVDVTREPATVADAGSLPSVIKIVGGYDGANAQVLATDASGVLQVDVANEPAVTVSGVSTAAKQDTIIGHLDGVEGLLTTIDADTGNLATILTRLTEIEEAVDGLEALLGTSNTNTGAAVTALQILDNAIAGNEMQVDVVAALPAGTNAIGKLAANSGVDIGDVDVTSIAAGTNLIGNVGLGVRTTGGLTIFRSLDIDETEEDVKTSAGQLYWYHYANRTAEELFLKFYNATAANVTVGSTTPVLTIPIAKESQGHVPIPQGFAFSTAITVACVKGVADSNAEGPAANGCVINLGYA